MTSLTDQILGKTDEVENPSVSTSNEPSLTDKILTKPNSEIKKEQSTKQFDINEAAAENRSGVMRGVRDVIDTGAHALGRTTAFIAENTLPVSMSAPIRKSVDEMLASDKAERDAYNNSIPADSTDYNRMIGQTLATAPLVPAKAVQYISRATNALPVVLSTGEKVAAPLLNRAAAAAGIGGVGGATYGAATSSQNDNSTLENTATGLITGALTGPAITVAGGLPVAAMNAGKSVWANININKLAADNKLIPSAAKNIVQRLEDAGLTPQTAQAELNRMGPNATIADLDASLTTEASGVASLGGKPTAILKGRFADRADTANSNAVQIMESKLGPRVNLENEKQTIIKDARSAVSADYDKAHASKDKIDVTNILRHINKELPNAVGSEAGELENAKSYLYKTVKQSGGGTVDILKDDVASLHKVRQALDDRLDKLPIEGTSQKSNTYRAVSKIRDLIDERLKTNSDMAAADLKFANKMAVKDNLQYGYEALTKNTNKDEFADAWKNADPVGKEAIKKGMRAAIGELMDRAQQGELSGAQRLFGKKSVNRTNLELAFGKNGVETLEALKNEASQRATEQAVRFGAQTAERLAVQKRYGEHAPSGIIGDAAKGAVLDVVTGTPGLGAAISGAKRAGHNAMIKVSNSRLERLSEGTADLLSRTGPERDKALSVLQTVMDIRNKNLPVKKNPSDFPLPTTLPTIAGETGYNQLKSR